jgi:general secretion pathway protein B
MSLILDALRKMELERKARRQSSHELRSDVLNYRGTAPAAVKPRVALIVSALLVVFASAAGIFYHARPEPKRNDPVKAAEPRKQERPPVIPAAPVPELPARPLPQKALLPEEMAVKEAKELAVKTLKSVQKSGEEGSIVSGIAWQDERSLRRAVINGALVGEGAEILGAKVVEIRENLVRFNRGGELFEIVYSSGSGR